MDTCIHRSIHPSIHTNTCVCVCVCVCVHKYKHVSLSLSLSLSLHVCVQGFNEEAVKRIGVDAVTLLDEFAENLLEELDYTLGVSVCVCV